MKFNGWTGQKKKKIINNKETVIVITVNLLVFPTRFEMLSEKMIRSKAGARFLKEMLFADSWGWGGEHKSSH